MREHKVDNYIGGAGKWEERSDAHHVFLRLQPRKAGQSWWVDIKVAANAEVVAVVEDTDIIISSFIKVMDISPSITILVAILAVSEKPNALSLRWPISTTSALWPAAILQRSPNPSSKFLQSRKEIAAASITGSPADDASSVQAAKRD
jgi:hypothetical protein